MEKIEAYRKGDDQTQKRVLFLHQKGLDEARQFVPYFVTYHHI
jgi:hypothetical protein